ncbi:MAG: glycosyltransferase family 9 protein [Salibacteraceae bacterium]
MRLLKRKYGKQAQVHVLCKKPYELLHTHNPHVDETITIINRVSEVADRLRKEKYDYVIDLHNNLRSFQAKRICKAQTFSVDKRNVAKWVYVNFKRELLPIGHFTDRCINTLAPLGVEDDGEGLDFFSDETARPASELLPYPPGARYVAYAIGGKMGGKILPTHQAIRLCESIAKPVVLLGGKEDADRGAQIARQAGGHVINLAGKTDLFESANIMRSAELVLSHDTGMMHIAAALKKPVFSLWLATTPQLGFAPWRPGIGSRIFEADCKKRPTSKLGNRGYKSGCVFNLDLEKVAAEVNQFATQETGPNTIR